MIKKFNENGNLICKNHLCWHKVPGGNVCTYNFSCKNREQKRFLKVPDDCPYDKKFLKKVT
jgi:hypothetical protein